VGLIGTRPPARKTTKQEVDGASATDLLWFG
jgi:hypothetical protein